MSKFKTVVLHKTALTVAQYDKLKEVSNSHGSMALGMMWFTLLQDKEMDLFDRMLIVPVTTIWHESNGMPINN